MDSIWKITKPIQVWNDIEESLPVPGKIVLVYSKSGIYTVAKFSIERIEENNSSFLLYNFSKPGDNGIEINHWNCAINSPNLDNNPGYSTDPIIAWMDIPNAIRKED